MALTLGENEDILLGTGADGLAELGSLRSAHLNLVLLLYVSSDTTYVLELGERRCGSLLLDLGAGHTGPRLFLVISNAFLKDDTRRE